MRRRSGLVAALWSLSACTQILGMERGELEQDNGGSGPGGGDGGQSNQSLSGVPSPGHACETAPVPSCSDCLRAQCSDALDDCLSTTACRAQLDKYALCLGRNCAGDQETCARGIDPVIFTCFGRCAASCGQTGIVSPCAQYCACMQQCPAELPKLGTCIDTCRSWPAEVRNCRRDHCEWGAGDALHCRHASGAEDVCPSYADRPVDTRNAPCTDGNESTWACDTDVDCCSGICLDGACR